MLLSTPGGTQTFAELVSPEYINPNIQPPIQPHNQQQPMPHHQNQLPYNSPPFHPPTGAVPKGHRKDFFSPEEREVIRQLFVTTDLIPTLTMDQINLATEKNSGGFRAIWVKTLKDKNNDKVAAAEMIRAVQQRYCIKKPKLTQTRQNIPLSPKLKLTPIPIQPWWLSSLER